MLKTFLSLLRSRASNDPSSSRRRQARRETDRCVMTVCGQTFPVQNWSAGGVLITGDDRLFGVGQDVELTLKFKLNNTIMDVTHHGQVVRKGHQKIAITFAPLSQSITRSFRQVVDDAVAREFAASQAT